MTNNSVNPAMIEKLNKKLDELIAEFNGTITHRNAQSFKSKWKEFLKAEGVHGEWWLNDLLRKRGL